MTPQQAYNSLIIAFSPNQKQDKNVIDIWNKVLSKMGGDIIKAATNHFIETWTTEPYKPRIPTQADFLKVCQDIKKNQIDSDRKDKIEDIKPLSKKEAAAIHSKIAQKLKTVKPEQNQEGQTEEQKIDFGLFPAYECERYYYCAGIIKHEDFVKICINQFGNRPKNSFTSYRRWGTKINRDSSGKIISSSNTWIYCNDRDKGAKPVTIGQK
jgi:hypothetical protein